MQPIVLSHLVVVSAASCIVALLEVHLTLPVKLTGWHARVEKWVLVVYLLLHHQHLAYQNGARGEQGQVA